MYLVRGSLFCIIFFFRCFQKYKSQGHKLNLLKICHSSSCHFCITTGQLRPCPQNAFTQSFWKNRFQGFILQYSLIWAWLIWKASSSCYNNCITQTLFVSKPRNMHMSHQPYFSHNLMTVAGSIKGEISKRRKLSSIVILLTLHLHLYQINCL